MTFMPAEGKARRTAAVLVSTALILGMIIAWEVYVGLTKANTRLISWEGLRLEVPRNFPGDERWSDGDLKILSFSVLNHDESGRYTHFFEVVSSSKKIDWRNRLPGAEYKLGQSERQDIAIDGKKAVLTSTRMTVTYPCGATQKAEVMCAQFYDPEERDYVSVLTYTMSRDTFDQILRSISCS